MDYDLSHRGIYLFINMQQCRLSEDMQSEIVRQFALEYLTTRLKQVTYLSNKSGENWLRNKSKRVQHLRTSLSKGI